MKKSRIFPLIVGAALSTSLVPAVQDRDQETRQVLTIARSH